MARPLIVPKLSEWTCESDCEHRDCAALRNMVGFSCTWPNCGEPMQEGDYYYGGIYTVESGKPADIAHAFHLLGDGSDGQKPFFRNVSEVEGDEPVPAEDMRS